MGWLRSGGAAGLLVPEDGLKFELGDVGEVSALSMSQKEWVSTKAVNSESCLGSGRSGTLRNRPNKSWATPDARNR